MLLLERLFGVGLYSLLLVFVCIALVGRSSKNIKRILFVYSILLSVMAYFYVPYETADLYRIYGYIESFQKYSFDAFIDLQMANSQLGLSNILYWLISRTGIPQLLPAIVSFICYNCIFYIIHKTSEKNDISGKNVAITLFFYMSLGTYIFVISGIRSMLGICLLAFCFFRESAQKKFNILHIPLYAIAVFIHLFSALLVAVRFVIPIFDTKTTVLRKIIYIIFLGAGSAFVFSYLRSLVSDIVDKAESYLSGNLYSYVWDYIIAILTCFVLLSIIIKRKKAELSSSLKLNVSRTFIIICFIAALCFCYEFSIFHRTTVYLLPIISIPMLMTLLQNTDNNTENQNARAPRPSLAEMPATYNLAIIAVSTLILLISCARGSLCSLKFFVL